jgi:hypothetical protein
VTTIAGSSGAEGIVDGVGSAARFFSPKGIAYDGVGDLYVSDTGGQTIRAISVATGVVTTIAGSPGIVGSADDVGTAARFNGPTALCTDGLGNLFVADTGNGTIRKIDLASGRVSTYVGEPGQFGVRFGHLPAGLNSPQGLIVLSPMEMAIVDQAENSVLLLR